MRFDARRVVVAVMLLGGPSASPALEAQTPHDAPLPDPRAFLEQVRRRLQEDNPLRSRYTFIETERSWKRDRDGSVVKDSEKVYEVFRDPELGYRRLVSKDGESVDPEKIAKAERKQRKKVENASRKRARESARDRERRLETAANERQKYAQSIDDAFRIFDATLEGREWIDGHPSLRYHLARRSDVKARSTEGRLWSKISGRVWFSETDHELVRVDMRVRETIGFGLGIVARLHEGTRLAFERTLVNDEIWLPSSSKIEGTARVLLLRKMHINRTSEFSDYRKFQTAATVHLTEPSPSR